MSRAIFLTGSPWPGPDFVGHSPYAGPLPASFPPGYPLLSAVPRATVVEWYWRVRCWRLSATCRLSADIPGAGGPHTWSLPVAGTLSRGQVPDERVLLRKERSMVYGDFFSGAVTTPGAVGDEFSGTTLSAFLSVRLFQPPYFVPDHGYRLAFEGDRLCLCAEGNFRVELRRPGNIFYPSEVRGWDIEPDAYRFPGGPASSATITVGVPGAATATASLALRGDAAGELAGCTLAPVEWYEYRGADGRPVWDAATGARLLDPLTAPVP